MFIIIKHSFACEDYVNDLSKSEISIWLGDNSLFSKAYKDGKCVLDKALVNIPIEQRRVIANLIAKSYDIEAKPSGLQELENNNVKVLAALAQLGVKQRQFFSYLENYFNFLFVSRYETAKSRDSFWDSL